MCSNIRCSLAPTPATCFLPGISSLLSALSPLATCAYLPYGRRSPSPASGTSRLLNALLDVLVHPVLFLARSAYVLSLRHHTPPQADLSLASVNARCG